jgi:Protein of unknown function (DUF1501)
MESLNAFSKLSPSGLTRRECLLASAGLGLSFLLPGLDLKAANRRGGARKKSVIVLWMAGGPSQLETWDPHPGKDIGGPTKAIETKVPELKIASLFPRMAEQIQHLNVIRSMTSKEGDHERGTYMLKTGYRPDPTTVHPSLGAIVAHELPDDRLEIPPHVSLGDGPWPARGGYLGDEYDAFRIYEPGSEVHNMRMPVPEKRQTDRLKSLDVVSRSFLKGRQPAVAKSLHRKTIEDALTMMTSEQLKAFKIEDEPQPLKLAYGESQFGRGCLVARRLIETGVRAVEVSLNGFDTHANNFTGHQTQAEILDPAFATLIEDLKRRDLLESTVVLCIGEFGRTPKINGFDGRDHWPTGFSCVVGGGGLRSGVVLGKTDPDGKKKDPTDPIPVENLFATVLGVLGVDFQKELITPIGRPMAISSGTPIAQLLDS